jgi:glycosyltransferase involved in cell wall biosynthesis
VKIALAVIAGYDAIEEGFERMLKSVEGKVDGVYVAYTGSENGVDDPVFDQIFDLIDPEIFKWATVSPVGWKDDFAAARNASFDLVRRAIERDKVEYDYILWLDCDDVVPPRADFYSACEEMKSRKAHGAFVNYEYQYDEEHDVVMAEHYKERLFRTDVDWSWIYPIHENCIGPMGARMTKLEANQYWTVRHLRGEVKPKRERNRRIVKKWFDEEGASEPRAVMFMAHETFAMAEDTEEGREKQLLLGAALKLYKQFIATTPPDDDSYACNRQVAEILTMLGRYDDAINIDLQGIKMQPTWPASYVGIAVTHHIAGDYEEAIIWSCLARSAGRRPDTLHAFVALDLDYKPWMIEGDSLMKLGRFDEACQAFARAQKIYPDEFTMQRYYEADRARTEYAEAVDHAEPAQPRAWGEMSEKSIAFFVPPSIEDWNPIKFQEEGLGGTETCVIRLAQELSNRGWQVSIFGSPGNFDGLVEYSAKNTAGCIRWLRSGAYHPDEPFGVFVALRSPEILDAPINAKLKILWLHDVSMGDVRHREFGDRFSKCDYIVCPSPFHIKHIMRVYDCDSDPWTADNEIMLNGFDRWHFDAWQFDDKAAMMRDPRRMAYASSPDRGLPRLLDLWPDIANGLNTQVAPNLLNPNPASLHIYYGWNSIDAIIAKGLPQARMLAHFKTVVQARIVELQEEGHHIVWHGRVKQALLGEHFKQSGSMLYPANFCETFGLVFAQAMTAGMIPVVPRLGFLPDLVGPEGIVVDGSPDSMEFGPRFVEAAVRSANVNDARRRMASERTEELSWNYIADSWESLIERKVGVKP